ncbi:RDD family protein [Streptomyces sp. NPDC037389]|uniref:RDD family protein n=1 Tax=Streptomyces sp. NPDC037389 TaxID=3155369 RepID=UPI0033F76211
MSHYQQPPAAGQNPYGQNPYGQQPPYGYGQPQSPYYPPPMPPMGAGGPPPQALAGQGARLGARILDGIFMIIPMIVVAMISAGIRAAADGATPLSALVTIVGMIAVFFLYEPLMLSKSGSTFGKRICGIRVARLSDGQNLSYGGALWRMFSSYLMAFVPFLGLLNILWCLWDSPYRQCLHDKAASSVVVLRSA